MAFGVEMPSLKSFHSPTSFWTFSKAFFLVAILASPAVVDSCNDLNWADSQKNIYCSTFKGTNYCTPDGQYGSAWSFSSGFLSIPLFTDNNGVDAFAACCACGGGDTYIPPTCQLTDWSEWSSCITYSCGSPQRIRTRNITNWGLNCSETEERLDCGASIPIPCPGGALFASGYNGEGQMGIGNTTSVTRPVQIELPNRQLVTDAAGGYGHTAIISVGQLFMTGFNRFGQLGLGDAFTRLYPQSVPFPHPDIKSIVKITCGSFQTAFLTNADWLYVMGRNNFGQLGLGDTVDRFVPTQVAGLYNVTAIAMGYQHFLVVANGTLYAAGSGTYGQLGLGDKLDRYNLTKVSFDLVPRADGTTPPGTVTLIAAGTAHSLALVDGELYGMGYNKDGRLGFYDDSLPKFWPVRITVLNDGQPPSDIAAGAAHSVILHNDNVYTTGDNTNGQLVQGPTAGTTLMRAGWGGAMNAGQLHPTRVIAMHKGTMVYGTANGGMAAAGGYNRHGQLAVGEKNNYRDAIVGIHIYEADEKIKVLAIFPGYYTTLFLSVLTVTPTLTSTVIPTITPTGTSTSSASPTSTKSSSSTQTLTMVPTFTGTPTDTLPYAPCSVGSNVSLLVDGLLQVNAHRACTEAVRIGAGSSSWKSRTVIFEPTLITSGLVKVAILTGCNSTSSKCSFIFSVASVRQEFQIPTDMVDDVELEIMYSPSAQATAGSAATSSRSTNDPVPLPTLVTIQVVVAEEPNTELTLLICLGGAGMMLLLVLSIWFLISFFAVHSVTRTWAINPRWTQLWSQLVIAIAAWLLCTGIIWAVALTCTSNEAGRPTGLIIAGYAMIGAGAGMLVLQMAWLLRDHEKQDCPVCKEQVSRWRFLGTYLPPDNESTAFRKAHTAHVRCVRCRSAVVQSGWPEAPKDRPYHNECWNARMAKVLEDPTYLESWFEKEGDVISTEELVHLLAGAIQNSSEERMEQILSCKEGLHTIPIAEAGGLTAMHLAAQHGNLPILLRLLDEEPHCLNPYCPKQGHSSLLVKDYGEEVDDVYVQQAALTYNSRPLYIGHAKGKYVYYFEPQKHGQTAGWFLCMYLGSANPEVRLPLYELSESQSAQEPLTITISGGSRSRREDSLTKRGQFLGNWSTAMKKVYVKLMAETQRQSFCSADVATVLHPMIPEQEEGLQWIPHATSVLEEAIRSGNREMIHHMAQLLFNSYPGCLLWSRHVGHGLWQDYCDATQAAIAVAMSHGKKTLNIELNNMPATLDLVALMQNTPSGATPIKCTLMTMFLDFEQFPYFVTSQTYQLQNWNHVAVLSTPGHCALAAPEADVLQDLCLQGLTSTAIWMPPCSNRESLIFSHQDHEQMFDSFFQQEVATAMGLSFSGTVYSRAMAEIREKKRGRGEDRLGNPSHRQIRDTGIASRMTDGLDCPVGETGAEFYPPGYYTNVGALPFCALLPNNPIGLTFDLKPIIEMAGDALMKINELQRQQYPMSPLHVSPLYVYTYELSYPGTPGDQIYGAMNKAMRLRDEKAVVFWRPLIWLIDVALEALPTLYGKFYRGINCRFDHNEYSEGAYVCWPAFSSASCKQSVAEEFAKGSAGSLFFLHNSSGKSIERISRFPEEAEVLFPPNTVFEVTSVLLGSSHIGSFYSQIDNIAMQQHADQKTAMTKVQRLQSADWVPASPYESQQRPGHTKVVLWVSKEIPQPALFSVSIHGGLLEGVELKGENQDGTFAEMTIEPNWNERQQTPCTSPSPLSFLMDTPRSESPVAGLPSPQRATSPQFKLGGSYLKV